MHACRVLLSMAARWDSSRAVRLTRGWSTDRCAAAALLAKLRAFLASSSELWPSLPSRAAACASANPCPGSSLEAGPCPDACSSVSVIPSGSSPAAVATGAVSRADQGVSESFKTRPADRSDACEGLGPGSLLSVSMSSEGKANSLANLGEAARY